MDRHYVREMIINLIKEISARTENPDFYIKAIKILDDIKKDYILLPKDRYNIIFEEKNEVAGIKHFVCYYKSDKVVFRWNLFDKQLKKEDIEKIKKMMQMQIENMNELKEE